MKFLELPNGIPDSDTFRQVFERIDPSELSVALNNWIAAEREKRAVVAIDGKTIRGSKNGKHKAYHVISAFVAENQITLEELSVEEKTNEITAVPELLDIIDVEGTTVTADAMSCQKKITDYFNEFSADLSVLKTSDKGHGRIERREYRLLTEIDWLEQKEEWCGLHALGMVKSTVTENEETREYTRYFITSLIDINEFADSVRKHWSIENQLHWCLDVIFREDASRAKLEYPTQNRLIYRFPGSIRQVKQEKIDVQSRS